MKAWGITEFGPATNLKVVDAKKPTPGDRDLLVKMSAVATNPIDYKIRSGAIPSQIVEVGIQGWDGSGTVQEVGAKVQRFKVGDEVYFSGNVFRPGCHAEYCLVDERISAKKPAKLSHEDAAALPLTTLTAWEGLLEGFVLDPEAPNYDSKIAGKSVLFVGGAGGVGAIGIQLAKKVFKIPTVIATASRPETIDFCKKMGADHVIDHRKNLKEQLTALGFQGVNYLYNTVDANSNWKETVDCILPQGKLVVITGVDSIDCTQLWFKRISLFPEIMFSRPIFMGDTEDWAQYDILTKTAALVDEGVLVTTRTTTFDFAKLPDAHVYQESGKSIGKQVATVKF